MTDPGPLTPEDIPPASPDGAPAPRGKRPSLIERAGGTAAWRGLVVPQDAAAEVRITPCSPAPAAASPSRRASRFPDPRNRGRARAA